MFQTVAFKRWAFVFPKHNARESREFFRLMHEVAYEEQYDMADSKTKELPDDRTATFAAHVVKELMQKDHNLTVIVVTKNAGYLNAAFKKLKLESKKKSFFPGI